MVLGAKLTKRAASQSQQTAAFAPAQRSHRRRAARSRHVCPQAVVEVSGDNFESEVLKVCDHGSFRVMAVMVCVCCRPFWVSTACCAVLGHTWLERVLLLTIMLYKCEGCMGVLSLDSLQERYTTFAATGALCPDGGYFVGSL